MERSPHSVEESIRPEGQEILVTGGAGFIGSHLVDALVDRNNVRVLDDLTSGSRSNVHPEATLIEGDIRNETTLKHAMAGVDLVFHEAAVVSVQRSIEEPRESHAINVDGSLSVLECARHEDARVVLASSAAVYGEPEYIPINEEHPTEPMSPYGFEKFSLDEYARMYHELYGLETVSLRYFNAYGPRQTGGDYSGVISIFLDQARSGVPITVNGDGKQTRDFVHISDIVQANLLAAETETIGEVFNIGTGEVVTINELAEVIRTVTGSESEITHTNPRSGEIEESQADISKAHRALGFKPQVTLEDGLRSLATESKREARTHDG